MKNKVINFGQDCWQMLTEVPGWRDAPRKFRLRRALPILVPLAIILLLLTWNKAVRDHRIETERTSHQALLAQDQELEALRLNVSDQQTEEVATHAAAAARQVLNDRQELASVLANLKKQAAEKHWNGTFQASDLSTDSTAPSTPLIFLQARAKLTPAAGNTEAFSTLLALLDRLSSAEKRIDLTRLGIRADEQGRYTVELNLRLVARSPNEKNP